VKCGHGDDVDAKYLKQCNTTEEAFQNQLPPLPTNKTYTLCRKEVTTIDFDVNESKLVVGFKIVQNEIT